MCHLSLKAKRETSDSKIYCVEVYVWRQTVRENGAIWNMGQIETLNFVLSKSDFKNIFILKIDSAMEFFVS
jgi:hypothetical protein